MTKSDELLIKLMLEQCYVPTYAEIVDYVYKKYAMKEEIREYCPTILKENFNIFDELKKYIFFELINRGDEPDDRN